LRPKLKQSFRLKSETISAASEDSDGDCDVQNAGETVRESIDLLTKVSTKYYCCYNYHNSRHYQSPVFYTEERERRRV
jgi:hypothetical protein